MKNLKYSNGQTIALVILRILVGWHFLYEGMVKLIDPNWSAASFLTSSQGPLAAGFKYMASCPVLLEITNQLNQWGLLLIGLSLIIGLLNRWACIGGIVLLFMYYISNPPFIGISTTVAEGSYLIVNKNLIEMGALLALYFFPSEHIIGLKRLIKPYR